MLRRTVMIMLLMAAVLFPIADCCAQRIYRPSPSESRRLGAFLQEYVRDLTHDYKATHYIAAFVDLKDDGAHEALVYLNGQLSCGSEGCTTLILVPNGGSYVVLTRLTITRLPIRVLTTKSNAWHDISVQVAGGGIQPGYEAILSFDGKSYPWNPAMPPARKSDHGKIPGKVAISYNAKGQLLFP